MEILDRVVITAIKLKVTLHVIQDSLAYMHIKLGCYCYGEHTVIMCLEVFLKFFLVIKQADIARAHNNKKI